MCFAARAPCAREVRYNGLKLVEMLCQEKMQRKYTREYVISVGWY